VALNSTAVLGDSEKWTATQSWPPVQQKSGGRALIIA
jgi:hypothetical protein